MSKSRKDHLQDGHLKNQLSRKLGLCQKTEFRHALIASGAWEIYNKLKKPNHK